MNRWMLMSVLMTVLISGCGTDCRKPDVEPVPEVSLRDTFFADITVLEQEQGVEVVMTRLLAMLNMPDYAEIRPEIFDYLLYVFLKEGQLQSAQDLYLELGGGDAVLAQAGFRQIMFASMAGDAESSTAWLEKIIASPLPDVQRTAAWQSRMELYAQSGSVAPVASRLKDMSDGGLAASMNDIVSIAFSKGIQISDFDGVELLLNAIRPYADDNAVLNRTALSAMGAMLVGRGQLDKALDHYLNNAALLGDQELIRGLRPLLQAARDKGLTDLTQRAVEAVYAFGDVYPVTRNSVAVWTIDVAVDQGDPQRLLQTTQKAFEQGVPVVTIYPAFLNGFYPAVENVPDELRSEWLALISKMRKTEGLPERFQSMMATALLDGAFFAQDYKAALAIVEEGIAGFDEKWHAELKDKINAHIALQEKRYDEAVALFQKHIERVSAWTEPAINPEDGRPVIKEVVLGLNEKRIGDIWSGVEGRSADARAAYARARQHYQDALTILDKSSPEYARASAELAEVPAAE